MFDYTKAYAHKKNIVAALRKVGVDLETVIVFEDKTTGKWMASPKPVEPVAPVAKPKKDKKSAPKTVARKSTPGVKIEMPTQNGIKQPKAGGLCAKAWELFDKLGHAVDVKTAVAEGEKLKLNAGNIRTEICRWRKFHGIATKRG